MYSKTEFISEVTRLYPTIEGQNSWAKKYFALEMPVSGSTVAEVNAARCWELYCKSRDNGLGFLLLGEVSMRSKLALVQNFSLTSAHGHEDDEPWLSPWLGSPAPSGADPLKLGKMPASTLDEKKNAHLKGLQGPGSILSDRLWTPLMNDAWLLGGVQKRQSFHLVTEGLGEARHTKRLDGLRGKEKLEKTILKYGTVQPNQKTVAEQVKDVWKMWFTENPQYLYETWGPRVLVRELIGLMTFGYEPEFSRQQLGFTSVNTGAADGSTITQYTDALNNLKFHQGADPLAKRTVLAALSLWMFGDAAVLT